MRAALLLALALAPVAAGQDPKPVDPPKPGPAPAPVVAVTVYQTTALVTRAVQTPDAAGQAEVVVAPLPGTVVPTSLYAEGGENVRVITARFRSRAISEDNRAEVRVLESKIKDSKKKLQVLEADGKALDANTKLLDKMEVFTAATLQHMTEKGVLDSEKTIALATFIRDARVKAAKESVALDQQREAIHDVLSFDERVLKEKSGGVTRTERDAVLVIEKLKAGPATVRLNYLVTGASWRPQYKLRAGTKKDDVVTVEYLAGVLQETGEDWTNAELTLSTAQPLLNASPPDLRSLEVVATAPGMMLNPDGKAVPVPPGTPPQQALNPGFGGQFNQSGFAGQGGGFGGQGGIAGGFQGISPAGRGAPGTPAGGAMPNTTAYLEGLDQQAKGLRSQAADNFRQNNPDVGNTLQNQAAAQEAYRDLVAEKNDLPRPGPDGLVNGPSVTYRLKTKLTIPSRSDDQIIEIARLDLAPKFYYKAVPVLTPNVYRIADLVNSTEYVFLPGEATMYLGTDFVGQARLPLVAAGKPFTVGFGVDPQLQATRKLVDRTRTTQGGNQVVTFKYRVLVNSYKTAPVDVQVWDRMPHAEAVNSIAVSLTKGDADVSKDALYVRDDRPKNLLRWDVKVGPKQNGENALAVDYEFRMEFAQTVNIAAFLAK